MHEREAIDGTSAFEVVATACGQDVFELREPADQRLPFVLNSPHSGRDYTPAFLAASRLDERTIRRSEDAHVDRLLAGAVALGVPVLAARFPRAFLDVNREPWELDQRMFAGPLPAHANTRSIRVAGGLGTIPRVVAEGAEIYRARLPVAEAARRIEAFYRPYHERLRRLIARTSVRFGYAVLVDCHSMPSQNVPIQNMSGQTPPGPLGAAGSGVARPDIVVGDRYGTSCAPALTRALVDAFAARGFRVTRNKPYAGGFITEHYGRPLKGLHAVQIEVNRALYMDEATLVPNAGFDRLRDDMTSVIESVAALPDAGLYPVRDDAADIAAQ